MAAKLFVGNLSFQATEEDLRELFQQAGNVETVRIITDQFTGRPRGWPHARDRTTVVLFTRLSRPPTARPATATGLSLTGPLARGR